MFLRFVQRLSLQLGDVAGDPSCLVAREHGIKCKEWEFITKGHAYETP